MLESHPVMALLALVSLLADVAVCTVDIESAFLFCLCYKPAPLRKHIENILVSALRFPSCWR